MSGTSIPVTPMITFPFAIARPERPSATRTLTTMTGAPESVANGSAPSRMRHPTATAITTASTERRPSSAQ